MRMLWFGFVFTMLVAAFASGDDVRLKVDHATVCSSDLNAMQDAFSHLGLRTDYGGPHARGGTHMAVLGFEDGSYLELIGPQRAGAETDSDWSRLMLADAGACAWAVGSANIDADVKRLKASGFPVSGPIAGGRKTPDGKLLQWLVAAVGTAKAGATLPFTIQDRTPREWRVKPSVSSREKGLTGVEAVVLGVKDLETAIGLFRKAYGWPAPVLEDHPQFGAKLAHFSGTPVILATPLGADSWLTKRLSDLGESPIAFLLGAHDFEKATHQATGSPESWFGRRIAWFDAKKLKGARIGIIAAR